MVGSVSMHPVALILEKQQMPAAGVDSKLMLAKSVITASTVDSKPAINLDAI
jgi:hypothetical protein